MFEQQTSQPSGWKAGVVYWIDKNYGTPEQLQQLGLQPRAWYQFNLFELALSSVVFYTLFHVLGYF